MHRAILLARVASLGLCLLPPDPAVATTVLKMTLDDLALGSAAIVMVRVENETARWDANHREIHTYITLRVLQPLKGGNDRTTITLRQLGGQVGTIASIVPGMPSFRRDEEAILFLTENDAAGYPWVMGFQQGKYAVTTHRNGSKSVRNDLDGLRVISPGGAGHEPAQVSKDVPLNAFLDHLKTVLHQDGQVEIDPTLPEQ